MLLCWVSRIIYCYDECRYAECRYAKCRSALQGGRKIVNIKHFLMS
jgi:hypothetical protein